MDKRTYKLVKQDQHNEDQYLLGFYETEMQAREAIRDMPAIYPHWIKSTMDLIVKRIHPDMIPCPVGTDYEHYLRWLIPDDEWKRVMDSDARAEISANNMTCGRGTYYMLSKMIPKDWTVIDFGCAYNPQSYLFMYHQRHIAIEPPYIDKDFHFEYFKAPNTELLFMTGQDFLDNELHKLDLDLNKTFAIVNYVPSGACNLRVRDTFKNLWCFYPA